MTFSAFLAARQPTGGPLDATVTSLARHVAAGRIPGDARWPDVEAVAGVTPDVEQVWRAFEMSRARGDPEAEPASPADVVAFELAVERIERIEAAGEVWA